MSTDSQLPSPPSTKLRVVVIILAVIATGSALSGLSIFGDLAEYADSGWGQWTLIAGRGILPFLAIPALVFAIKGDIRRAIMALAAIVIVIWLTDSLPSMIRHGLEFTTGGIVGIHLFALEIVYPLLSVVAFVLARRNDRLGLATFFLSLGPLTHVISVIGFAVGVAIYGF